MDVVTSTETTPPAPSRRFVDREAAFGAASALLGVAQNIIGGLDEEPNDTELVELQFETAEGLWFLFDALAEKDPDDQAIRDALAQWLEARELRHVAHGAA